MKQDYKRIGVMKFGRTLLETEDLDPIYTMLWKAKLNRNRLKRWIMAYCFFYHAGVSSLLSSYHGTRFWGKALKLAKKSKTPRGTERRHFRGPACFKAIDYFDYQFESPEEAIDTVIRQSGGTVDGILTFVGGEWPMFGPWIGFKLADLLERLGLAPIAFPIKTLSLYSEPRKGAALIAERMSKIWAEDGAEAYTPDTTEVVEYLLKRFKEYEAPPRYERPVNAQEIETILCKWKSHMGGHYPLGKDTHEIREGLHGWGKLATRLIECLPSKRIPQ